MSNSEHTPGPSRQHGRLGWLVGLAVGVMAGAFVAFELAGLSI